MTVVNTTYFDGIKYEAGDTLPEFGSLVPSVSGTTHEYSGLEKDKDKLPTVAKYPKYKGRIATGSSFFSTDTKKLFMYEATTDTWY